MALLGAIFFGFVPAFLYAGFVNWLDRYEKEPKLLLGTVFFWGVVVAGGGAFIINTVLGIGFYVFTGDPGATDFFTASVAAPFVEEGLKGLAVLAVFLVFHREFDSILDGIVYAAITALGFTAIENVLYIYRNGFQEGGWQGFWLLVFIRVVLVGWQHAFYTSFTGIGLAIARMNRNFFVKIIAVVGGYLIAVAAHSFHNTFGGMIGGLPGLAVGTLVDWTGWFFMLIFIIIIIRREGNLVKKHLKEEVAKGLITQTQFNTATSAFGSSGASFKALMSGRYRAVTRFYQVCGELSHKKEQLAKLGDEHGNTAIIAKLEAELGQLAPQVG